MTTDVLILGDHNVGKTSIIYEYLQKPTRQKIFVTTDIKIYQQEFGQDRVDVKIIDTPGKGNYSKQIKKYIDDHDDPYDAIIFCFDLSNRSSFENVTQMWNELVKNKEVHSKILIGHKCDLRRQVSSKQAIKMAVSINACAYYQTTIMKQIQGQFQTPKTALKAIIKETIHRINFNQQSKQIESSVSHIIPSKSTIKTQQSQQRVQIIQDVENQFPDSSLDVSMVSQSSNFEPTAASRQIQSNKKYWDDVNKKNQISTKNIVMKKQLSENVSISKISTKNLNLQIVTVPLLQHAKSQPCDLKQIQKNNKQPVIKKNSKKKKEEKKILDGSKIIFVIIAIILAFITKQYLPEP